MKIRMGFVSNSSSSSFCIAGICTIDNDQLKKICNIEETDNFPEEISVYNPEDWKAYIGINIEKMKDNETKAEFIARSQKLLDEILPEIKKKASIIHYGWYNG